MVILHTDRQKSPRYNRTGASHSFFFFPSPIELCTPFISFISLPLFISLHYLYLFQIFSHFFNQSKFFISFSFLFISFQSVSLLSIAMSKRSVSRFDYASLYVLVDIVSCFSWVLMIGLWVPIIASWYCFFHHGSLVSWFCLLGFGLFRRDGFFNVWNLRFMKSPFVGLLLMRLFELWLVVRTGVNLLCWFV